MKRPLRGGPWADDNFSQCGAIVGEAEKAPKAKRRWYQFHLWHLFVLLTVGAVACSYLKIAVVEREKARHIPCEDTLWTRLPYYLVADGANQALQPDVTPEQETDSKKRDTINQAVADCPARG